MSKLFSGKRRGAVLALALSVFGSLAIAQSPAFADSTPVVTGNIDSSHAASLTVHKYEAPEWDQGTHPADGTEITNAPTTGFINGVTFTLQKVDGVDLTDNAGWKKLKTYTANPTSAPLTGQVYSQTTSGQGTANFANLPQGAYLLTETNAPDTVTKKSAPKIITIPYPASTANSAKSVNGWIYDVHVYPKNEVSNKVSKTIAADTPTTTVGSEIKWVLNVPVPKVSKNFQKFIVHDDLVDNLKKGTTATVVKLDGSVLADSKYTVTGGDNAGDKMVFNFANALTDLDAAKGKNLEITFYTTVVTVPENNQIPNNDYNLTYNNGGTDITPPPPNQDDNPKAYFGNYHFKKVSSVGNKLPLQGAVFSIYANDPDTNTGETAIGTATSDANGVVKFDGYYRGSNASDEKTYYIKETTFPVGYAGTATAIAIKFSATSGTTTQPDVENTPHTGIPDLPHTGAAGKVLLTLAGIAILAIAGGTAFTTRRRKATK